MTAPERLVRLLGGAETAWLRERVRARIAAGRPLSGSATRGDATPDERAAIESLLGRAPGVGRSLSVRLEDVDRALREAGLAPDGLAAAVIELTGPVPDRRADARDERARWRHAHSRLDPAVGRHPELAEWRAWVEARGVLKRCASGDPELAATLAARASQVLAALPARGVSRAVFAAATTGSAHDLDDNRPLATLIRRAVSTLAQTPTDEASPATSRRAAWAAVGVAADELSPRVLALGLPGGTDSTTGRMLALAAAAGEPCVLTLRQLTRSTGALGVGESTVYVCENPAVVSAAADRLGSACPPLVCVEGNLSVAARMLLCRLAEQGGRLHYHGDFDWGGVRIAARVFALGANVTSWRFDAISYREAVASGLGSPLHSGLAIDTLWDRQLRGALVEHAIRVEEEHLIGTLLADLSADVR